MLGLSRHTGISWEVHSQLGIVLLQPYGSYRQISNFSFSQKTVPFHFQNTESFSFLPLSCAFLPTPQAKQQEQVKCYQNVHCRGQFPLMDDMSITGGSSFSLLSLKYISNYQSVLSLDLPLQQLHCSDCSTLSLSLPFCLPSI